MTDRSLGESLGSFIGVPDESIKSKTIMHAETERTDGLRLGGNIKLGRRYSTGESSLQDNIITVRHCD